MKRQIITALVVGALSAAPLTALAAQAPAAAPAARTAKPAAATHSMKGVVKSIDAKTLVLTGSGGNHGDMSFALNASTRREGKVAPGNAVSVRYRDEGKTHVATAISVEHAGKSSPSGSQH